MASIKGLLFLFFFVSFLALSCLKEIKVVEDSVAPEQLQPFSKGFDYSRLLSSRPPRSAPAFDCEARILAYQFARSYLLPNLGPLSTVYEALELDTLCQKSLHELERQISWEQTKPSFRQKVAEKEKLRKKYFSERKVRPTVDPFHLTAPNTLYVDANNGKDTNPGTFSQPFQTIQKAVMASRALTGQTAILLRQGTFYLAEPLQLGAEDSDLIILSFRNERVFISGGIPLKTQWKPYNVSRKASLQSFTNANNVYGRAQNGADTDTIKYLGTFDSVEPCQQGCLNYGSRTGVPCRSYTYHTKQLGGAWAGQCFAVINEVWGPALQDNVISGRFVQPNIYVADLSQQGIKSIPGLQTADGASRKIRARYPDGHPETTFFPAGWILNAKSWIPPAKFNASQIIVVDKPSRNDTTMFQKYTIGIGGACEIFTPPESYWCSPYNEGGGATVFNTPRGLSFDPNTIYGPVLKNLAGSTLHTWHPYHWASWMYHIDTFDPSTNTITWTKGGFQGARGTGDANKGGEFYFENSLDLLDSPEEYYFDEKSQLLYYFYNGTGTPPSSLQLVASNLKTLVEAVGTQDRPVRNLTFQGITFVNAAYTYMDPHGVPSGGDWALQRSGALYFEGTENLLINNCTFMRLDGNGMMLSGYHRHTTIANSEFAWIGDTPLGLWGHTQGIDGTNGEQPRFTNIISNIFRELGHFEKQSSPVFQAKTCQTLIYKNIMFNGPRALINFNDGFGGGNIITENLLFNANRETSDQGPFNSWDRMPFLTEVRDGKTPSLTPAYNDINTNFFICNYGSNMCIDNDDGSSYYLNHHNFEVYGGHKSDYGGHNKFTYNTLAAFSQDFFEGGLCGDFNDAIPGFVDGYYNNTCVQAVWVPYIILECDPNKPDPSRLPKLNNNKVYNSNNSLSVKCGDKVFTEEEWQALGFDQGTRSFPLPTDDEIISWAKEILGI